MNQIILDENNQVIGELVPSLDDRIVCGSPSSLTAKSTVWI